jgi:hypothetical protein
VAEIFIVQLQRSKIKALNILIFEPGSPKFVHSLIQAGNIKMMSKLRSGGLSTEYLAMFEKYLYPPKWLDSHLEEKKGRTK